MRHLEVIYEDNHLIAINKPAGVLVQGDQTGDTPISEEVKFYIKHRYNKPGDVYLGVIHRLDRPVSGALIFARTSKGLTRMNALFQQREIQKRYLAISKWHPDELNGRIETFLFKDKSKNKVRLMDKPSNRTPNAKKAITEYRLLSEVDGNYLYEVNPITGRPHQIRAHMQSVGAPLKGDLRYGAKKALTDASICLHCFELSFVHPVKKEPVTIKANIPKHQEWNRFKNILKDHE
ncbi:MAG: RluA family pseudouridine synthase [Saprospiraceae bacterium]|nr:RluA family pseudouridine synthase [Saprospiraceae bacterium]